MKKRRWPIAAIIGIILASAFITAATFTDNTPSSFQAGSFLNTTANGTGVLFNSMELSADASTVDLVHFNENTDVKAIGVNGRLNVTLAGNAAWITTSRFGASAISFDGDDDYTRADTYYFSNLSSATLEFWFRPNATHTNGSQQQYLWQYLRANNQYARIWLETDGTLHYRYQRSGLKWDIATSRASWNVDDWQHVAVTCGDSGAALYVNGDLAASSTETDCLDDFGSGFTLYHTLGADYTGGSITKEFAGAIDELKLYDQTLSASEIRADATSYFTRGTYTSSVKDAGKNATWLNISLNWTNTDGNNLLFQLQSCDDAACDGEAFIGPDNTSATRFAIGVANLGTTDLAANRYFRYRAFLSTNSSANTPFLLNATVTYDADAPAVTLLAPVNNSGNYNGSIVFTFNVSDDIAVANCSLSIDDVLNSTIAMPTQGTNSFSLSSLASRKRYLWSIFCTDQTGKQTRSENRTVSVIAATKFNATDLSATDLNSISGYYLDGGFGSINFTESVDLSGITDIDSYLVVEQQKVSLNSSALSGLNKAAFLQMRNVNVVSPEILRDDILCPETVCTNRTYENLILTFHVTGFSEYRSREALPQHGKACDREHELELPENLTVQPGMKMTIPITIRNTGDCALYDIKIRFIPPTGWDEEQEVYYRRIYRSRDTERGAVFTLTAPRDARPGGYHATVRTIGKSVFGNLQIPILVSLPMKAAEKREQKAAAPVQETAKEEKDDLPLQRDTAIKEAANAADGDDTLTGYVVKDTEESAENMLPSRTSVARWLQLAIVVSITFFFFWKRKPTDSA